jgi:hypothetical protein
VKRIRIGLLLAGLAAAVMSVTAQATDDRFSWEERPRHFSFPSHDRSFQRVATLGNYLNNGADGDEETVSEIVAATADGRTLVYTDAVRGTIGLIDITDPSDPQPLGTFPVGDDASPTSVDVLGSQYALVAVDTSDGDFINPSGALLVVDISDPAAPFLVANHDLGGQPDSIKISPDERFVAIAIENQRDEDVTVDDVEGGLPQLPAGYLAVYRILNLVGPVLGPRTDVDLTGLAGYVPNDPEPEFVDINARNEAVVTLQENNHIVIVDLTRPSVKSHFSAGAVDLSNIDAVEDGVISLTDSLEDVPREPDAVAWLPGLLGVQHVATVNEGDLFGGSRGFTIFRPNGSVLFDSGNSIEEMAVRHGHYPEGRSDAKGTEPEAIAYARYGLDGYLFVGTERGSFVAVYKLDLLGRPRFEQLLPGPIGPEGLLPIPQRNLLVVSGEVDLEDLNARSNVMIYQLKRGGPTYPQIVSDDRRGSPIPWSALSGMVGVPWRPHSLLAVWDQAYSVSNIFRIDVSKRPAVITGSMTITGGGGDWDPEGIAIAPDKTLWVASEGTANDGRPNLLVQVNAATGAVITEVGLPANVLACRAAEIAKAASSSPPPPNGTATLGSGFEGVAVLPTSGGRYVLYVPQQRGWNYTTGPPCDVLDDDPADISHAEPTWTRIWIYDPFAAGPDDDKWSFVRWQLQPKPPSASWVGLSEITQVPGGWILIERDNRTGDFAVIKDLAKIDDTGLSDDVITNAEKSTYDLLPHQRATNGWITDKPEGVAVTANGRLFVATDNDGLDDWSGESWFFGLGPFWNLFD